ncbi:MAG: FecR domain-containing protein [Tannerellaceae bacterium]|nr:FecR domain-containing protein [Tannerellaceae bacterium]MCD8264912.1 FecR domain-containing protein [Tannerellaceae bacterium]
MDEKTLYTLIAAYLNQTASDEEIARLEAWLAASGENRKQFTRIKKAWLLTDPALEEQIAASRPQVWNAIIEKIPAFHPARYTRRILLTYCSLSAAATLLLLVGINLLFTGNLQRNTPQYTEFYLPKGEKGHIVLPDGTEVWVNADTRISLSNDFNVRNRKVRLEGEGYFEVTQDLRKKFIVETSLIDVVVHGTTFKLSAYLAATGVSVSLREGAVSIRNNSTKEWIANLSPNQQITVSKENYSFVKTDFNPGAYIAWTFTNWCLSLPPSKRFSRKWKTGMG